MLSYSVRLSFQWKDKRVLWGIHTIKLDLSTLLVIRDDESSQWILFEANYVSRCTFIPMFPITRTQDQDQETPGGCAVLSCFLRIFPPIREEWITYAKTTSPLKPPWNLGLLFIDRAWACVSFHMRCWRGMHQRKLLSICSLLLPGARIWDFCMQITMHNSFSNNMQRSAGS